MSIQTLGRAKSLNNCVWEVKAMPYSVLQKEVGIVRCEACAGSNAFCLTIANCRKENQ